LARIALRAVGHETDVRTDGDEPEALLDPPQRALRRAGVYRGDDTVVFCPRENVLDCRRDGRRHVVERARAAQGERQVRGADIDRIETAYRQDVVQVFEAVFRFDHREDDDRFVGALRVVAAAVDPLVAVVHAAFFGAAGFPQRVRVSRR
jgi:hypothetical protein